MLYLTIIGGAFIAWLILALLFTPHIPYHIEAAIDARSDHFVHVLESTCQTHLEHGNRVEILTNGDRVLPGDARRDPAARARRSTWSATSSRRARSASAFIDALCERARAGVRVTIVMDAIGSFGAFRKSAKPLRGRRLPRRARTSDSRGTASSRLNNRTHRELLVVDGTRRVRRRRRRRRLVGAGRCTASRCGAT